MGEGELELCLPSPMFGRGAGGEGKDLTEYRGFKSPGSKNKQVLGRGLSYKVAPLLPWRQPLPLGEGETPKAMGRPQDRNAALNPRHKT
jgi:hypothetical protein